MIYAKIVNGVVVTYPYTESLLRADNPQTSFPRVINMDDMSEFGVTSVQPNPPPSLTVGQAATEVDPVLIEGQWEQSWQVRSKTGEELTAAKEDKKIDVDVKVNEIFQAGFSPSTGPLAGHTLQVRDVVDRTNWLTSQASYATAVSMGYGAVEDAHFRTLDNQTIVTTYSAGLETLLAMAAWGKTIMGVGWAKKDAINAASSFAELEAIDINDGWPE